MSKTVKIEFRIPYNRGFRTEVKEVNSSLWDKLKDKPSHKRPGNWKYANEVTDTEVIVLNLNKTETKETEVVETPKKRGPKPKNKEEEKQEDEIQE